MNLVRGTFPHICPGDGCAICARLKRRAWALFVGVGNLRSSECDEIRLLHQGGFSVGELAEQYKTSPHVIAHVVEGGEIARERSIGMLETA